MNEIKEGSEDFLVRLGGGCQPHPNLESAFTLDGGLKAELQRIPGESGARILVVFGKEDKMVGVGPVRLPDDSADVVDLKKEAIGVADRDTNKAAFHGSERPRRRA